MAELRLHEESRPPRLLLSTSEWVDISNVASLLAAIERIKLLPDIEWVGLDFSDTEYIDSAAVSALIQTKSILEDQGKHFALVSVCDQIERVLQETRLISLFALFPDDERFWAGGDDVAPEA